MDAKAIDAVAGVGVGTINVWVSRGYVPGITADAQGRRRDFDINTATHIAIMAELTQFGLGAHLASNIAVLARARHSKVLIVCKPVTEPDPSNPGVSKTDTPTAFLESEKQVPKVMADLRKSEEKKGRRAPTLFVLVDVGTIVARMQAAHHEWERRQNPDEGRDG